LNDLEESCCGIIEEHSRNLTGKTTKTLGAVGPLAEIQKSREIERNFYSEILLKKHLGELCGDERVMMK
jgi:hypothetical protein